MFGLYHCIAVHWSMAEYSDRAPGYLSIYGATSDPWRPVYFKGTIEYRSLCSILPYMFGA